MVIYLRFLKGSLLPHWRDLDIKLESISKNKVQLLLLGVCCSYCKPNSVHETLKIALSVHNVSIYPDFGVKRLLAVITFKSTGKETVPLWYLSNRE